MLNHAQADMAADLALGGGDCEGLRPGLLHQPVNSLSSLAYVAAGVWIATRRRTGRADRMAAPVFGATVIGTGIGSLLYHGPQWPGSAILHDVAIPVTVLFVAVDDLALLRGWTVSRQLMTYATAVAAACLLLVVVPTAGSTVVALSAASALSAETALARRRQISVRAALLLGGTLLAAALTGLAGRTESPLCRPNSPLQGHALWHLLTAATFMQWNRLRRTRRIGTSRPPMPGGE